MKYFATLPTDEIGKDLITRVDDYYSFLQESGTLTKWNKAYRAYYGLSKDGMIDTTEIGSGGSQGELSILKVNHVRNLVQHLLNMTTAQRPAMQPRATNSDFKSQSQTILASGVLDYYLREKKLESALKKSVELALVFSEGFVTVEWDATSGEVYSTNPDTGAPVYEGDIKYEARTPLDVIRDAEKLSAEDDDWKIVRTFKNRFDLAEKYPEYAEDILRLNVSEEYFRRYSFQRRGRKIRNDVPVYTLFHRKSEAVPNGRQVVFLPSGLVLLDVALPYREIPVYRNAPGDLVGTPFGYTPVYDLLGIQQAIDSLYSIVTTNQLTNGVSNVMVPKGSDLSVQQISQGLNLIEYDRDLGKPEVLNLTFTPGEIFSQIRKLEEAMETLSGVNSVVRGNPEASLKSGAALAMVASQAIQFNSGLQQSYVAVMEGVGTATINTLRDFATVPRVAYIAGKHNRPLMKEFKGDDLAQINRVTVEVTNPVSKTPAGRLEIANQLMQGGLIKRPEQYISVLETGKLEPLIENEMSELLLVRAENEQLSEGQLPIATAVDDHKMHILEHKSVLASPEARSNPTLVKNATAHILEHIELLRTTDPALLELIGQKPLAPAQTPSAPGPIPEVMDATNPVVQNAQSVNLPQMPTNPLSGSPYDPQTGGL
jgi:hypothetical protein